MKQEDYRLYIKRHDRHVGIYKPTEEYKDKRDSRLNNVPYSVLSIAEWLIDNNIEFQALETITTRNRKVLPMMTDIYIPEYNIAMRYVDMDDEKSVEASNVYFQLMKIKSYPFFIRSNETEGFLLEKLQNCIKDFGSRKKSGLGKRYVLTPQKRKRIVR